MNAPIKISKFNMTSLADGEIYVGAIMNKDGSGHHIILLPGDSDNASWKEQMEWAESIGGGLPDRVEQAILYRDFSEHFQKDWYWSNQQREGGSAWFQYFYNGRQVWDYTYHRYRARAVRRLPI